MGFKHERKVVTRTVSIATLARRYAGPSDAKVAVYHFSGGKTKYEFTQEPVIDSGEGVPYKSSS